MWKRTVCLSGMLLLVRFPCLPKLELRSLTGVVTDKRGNGLPARSDSGGTSIRAFYCLGLTVRFSGHFADPMVWMDLRDGYGRAVKNG